MCVCECMMVVNGVRRATEHTAPFFHFLRSQAVNSCFGHYIEDIFSTTFYHLCCCGQATVKAPQDNCSSLICLPAPAPTSCILCSMGQQKTPVRSKFGIPLPNPPGFPLHELSPVPLPTYLASLATTFLDAPLLLPQDFCTYFCLCLELPPS